MLDGKGNVVRPDYVSIYYKQRPQSDPTVSNPSAPKYLGQGGSAPERHQVHLRMGSDGHQFDQRRVEPGSTARDHRRSPATTRRCRRRSPTAPPATSLARSSRRPECWDGKNLDSPDHRSHVAYASYGTWGYLKCPSTHPYNIPTFTMGAWYTVAAGDNTALWELSSDHMAPGQPKGHTFHADFFMAWDPTVHDMWWQNCINRLLNCSGGHARQRQASRGRGSADVQLARGPGRIRRGWCRSRDRGSPHRPRGRARLCRRGPGRGHRGWRRRHRQGAVGRPQRDLASTDQTDQVEAIEGGADVPATALTVLTEQGWSGAYAKALVEVARANDISPYLLEAVVWQESRWNPSARSRAGAIGLAQLMPGTARDLGVDPRDPIQNLAGGARYLRQQLNRFDGNVEKALAAYNAGPGRVMTAGGIPSIPETQAYVRAIVARLAANSIQEGKRQ